MKMITYGTRELESVVQRARLSEEYVRSMRTVAQVLPFRANNYVVEELIDWDNVPEDPIFQLTFPQPGMLSNKERDTLLAMEASGTPPDRVKREINRIRRALNPHPEGQLTHNVPHLEDEPVPGVQRKYHRTCLVFPSAGQTCHAYCTFCFRWAQFVGMDDLKFATDESKRFLKFIRRERALTDVIFTGGDPMVMKTAVFRRYVEPLLEPEFDHIRSIRIGSKSLSYWPYRYVTDSDADDLLRFFEKIVNSGKHLAFMAHFNHDRELSTDIVQQAIRRIRGTGAQIRTQAPLVRNINDDADVWSAMWRKQVNLGCVPYYMFVERDTGANGYFRVPLARALQIYGDASKRLSGLCHTVRGPTMSAFQGKVIVQGVTEILGRKVFVLNYSQARDLDWVRIPFFAEYDPEACWFTDLKPAFGSDRFFAMPGGAHRNGSPNGRPVRVREEERSRVVHV